MPSRSRRAWSSLDETALAALTVIVGSALAVWLARLRLLTSLIDENAHLNFARLITDSLTPGISQMGFWPPLLHVLLAPFAAVRPLYASALAGAVVSLPSLFLACVFLRRTVLLLTEKRWMGNVAALLLFCNPFMLYYGVVPMMEALFLAAVHGTAYALALWWERRDLRTLIATASGVALACLARYEGFLLLPVVATVMLGRTSRSSNDRKQTEAVLLLFGMLACTGLVFIVTYAWIFGGSPLAFMGGSWLRDPSPGLRPARLNVVASVLYTLYASFHMLGTAQVLTALVSAALFILVLRSRSGRGTAVLTVLAAPLLFVLLTQFTGSTIINVTDLPPYGFFNNVRYGLTWAGFVISAPFLLFAALQRPGKFPRALRVFSAAGTAALLGITVWQLRGQIVSQYAVIRQDINSPSEGQHEVASFLRQQYAGGRILMARADNDPIIAEAGIPLDHYIYEGNYRYFAQTLEEPWNFAEFVVMHHETGTADVWAAQNEPVYRRWGISGTFPAFYTLVFENGARRVYRLDRTRLMAFVTAHGFNASAIPSLQLSVARWDPQTVYAEMRASGGTTTAAIERPPTPEKARTVVTETFQRDLRPLYARGYYADPGGHGTSESQSYAMWQAFASNDRPTFDTVWQWTKVHLQRSDGLFAWKFSLPSAGIVLINDANSATDADTDIAYLLLRASAQWNDPSYAAAAQRIMEGIWDHETVASPSGRHVTAGNWAVQQGTVVMNPSYFTPYAYRLFAHHDPAHDWESLVAQGYSDITVASSRPVGAMVNAFLPPNWMTLDPRTGNLAPYAAKPDASDYSYDAFRTFFRVRMDDMLSPNPAAQAYLRSARTFERDWQARGSPCSVYFASAGSGCTLSIGPLAGPLAVWTSTQPAFADELVRRYYLTDQDEAPPSFYDRSWRWFALWMWTQTSG